MNVSQTLKFIAKHNA
jgi:2-oxoacid dehydrogenases acyltransferase (catalytic domain)